MWVALPFPTQRLCGLNEAETDGDVCAPAPEARWRNTSRWGFKKGDAMTLTQRTLCEHPQGVSFTMVCCLKEGRSVFGHLCCGGSNMGKRTVPMD